MKKFIKSFLLLPILFAGFCHAQTNNIFDIRTFGAIGDGMTLDTKFLQAAIDKCSAAGGGTEEDATNDVAELTPENLGNRWPEIGSLRKIIPAHGLFAHHVQGITLQNVEFTTKTPDAPRRDISGRDRN